MITPRDPAPADTSRTAPAADPMATALAMMAHHHGRQAHPAAFLAGLPLTGGRLTVEHLPAAAARLGLGVDAVAMVPARIRPEDLPILQPLKDGDVAVITGRAGKMLTLRRASAPANAVEMTARDLGRLGTGHILRVRPVASPDAEHAEPVTLRSWLTAAFADTRGAIGAALMATVLVNLVAFAMPLFTMNIYDRVIPNAALSTLWTLSLGAGLAIGFDLVIRTARAEIIDITTRRVDIRLANSLFARLLGARLQARGPSAGAQVAMLRDFEAVREFFQSLTLTTLGDLPFCLLFLAAIYVMAGTLVFSPLIVAAATIASAIIIQSALARRLALQHRDAITKNAVATEIIVGMETIKALGAESWAAGKWETSVADGIRQSGAIRRLSNLANHLVIAAQLVVTVAMVLHGTYLVLDGQITVGAIIASVMLAGRALSPVGQAALLVTRIGQTRLALHSLRSIIEAPQERPDGHTQVQKSAFDGRVTLEHLTVAYAADATPAVADVSLALTAGERVAVLGTVGSGKTTLLKAIAGLLPARSGRVYVDDVAVSHLDPALLRLAVCYVGQDPMLFRGTIRQNLTLHRPATADADILAALTAIGALGFVERLPGGLDHALGERGAGLSGGQRQALCLARALIARPSVLLLDEPTGSMDGRTEVVVLKAIADYARTSGATVLTVTHRPAVVEGVSRLIVMEGGRVRLDGPKESVLQALRSMGDTTARPAAETIEMREKRA